MYTDLPEDIPFAKSLEMIFDPKTPDRGICDIYIEDYEVISVDLPGNRELAKVFLPLASHTMVRLLDNEKHIPRQQMNALK